MSDCCGIDTVGGNPPGTSSAGAFTQLTAEMEIDLRDFDGQALPRGASTITVDGNVLDTWAGPDPLPANSTMAFGPTGLEFDCTAAAAATNFTESQDSAMYWGVNLGSIYTALGVDCTALLRVEAFAPSSVLSVSNYWIVCLRGWTNAVGTGNPVGPVNGDERIAGARRVFTGGEECFNSVATTNGGNRFVAGGPAPTVLGVAGFSTYWGAFAGFSADVSAGWPTPAWQQGVANGGIDGPLVDPLSWIVVSLASNSAAGNPMSLVLERLRIRAFAGLGG